MYTLLAKFLHIFAKFELKMHIQFRLNKNRLTITISVMNYFQFVEWVPPRVPPAFNLHKMIIVILPIPNRTIPLKYNFLKLS